MRNKKTTVLITLAAAATALLVTQGAWTRDEPKKLDGAWVVKVPGTPIQWTLALSPASDAGRSAAISGSLQVRIPAELMAPGLLPEFDPGISSSLVGEAVMTGHNKGKFTMVGYALNKVAPTVELPFTEKVAFIWVGSGEIKFTGSNRFESTGGIAYYLPETDGDGDGLPDANAAPILQLPASTCIGTRVSLHTTP